MRLFILLIFILEATYTQSQTNNSKNKLHAILQQHNLPKTHPKLIQNPQINSHKTKINKSLLLLSKHNTQATNILCQQYNMKKCGVTCCENQKNVGIHNRIFSESNQNIFFHNFRSTQKYLCQKMGEVLCGQQCCITGYCSQTKSQQKSLNIQQQDHKQSDYNLRFVQFKCIQNDANQRNNSRHDRVYEQSCKQNGLLWCDIQCCPFTAGRHQCFRVNHFGTPYIRCPIQDTLL